MKAIIITEELKSLNPNVLKGAIGFIKTFKDIPKSFKSLTYFNGRLTEGYHKLENSVHEADGFYNVVTPIFDANLQRLDNVLFFDVDKFTYNVINIPQAEIDAQAIKVAKDDFKKNLDGVFAYATTPDGTKEYGIKIGNDGKISTILIP